MGINKTVATNGSFTLHEGTKVPEQSRAQHDLSTDNFLIFSSP